MSTAGPTARRHRVHLRTRLLGLVLLTVVPLGALSIAWSLNDRRHATDDAHRRTAEIAATGATAARALVAETDVLLHAVNRITDEADADCGGRLDATLLPGSRYLNLYAVAPEGTVACAADSALTSTDVSDAAWFQRALERRGVAVTAPAASLTDDTPVMMIATSRTAVGQPATTTPGVLGASVALQTLVGFAADLDLPTGSVVQVLDEQGRVLARSVDDAAYLLDPMPLFAEMTSQGASTGSVDGRGVDDEYRLYSYEEVDVGGQVLWIMAGITRSDAFDRPNQRLAWSLAMVGLVGLLVGLVALAAAQRLIVSPIERLRTAITGFRSGDVDRRAGDIGGPAEVAELGAAFDAMAQELAVRLQNQERLLRQLDGATEAERQSIAAGIHDESLQNLSAVGFRLQLLRRQVEPAHAAELDRALELVDETASQLRGLLFDLRPPSLDRLGLAAALRETMEARFDDRLEGWSVSGEPAPGTPDWAQLLLYRVAQQALVNVDQHADARTVSVQIGDDGTLAWMVIRDDGRGFDMAEVDAHPRPGHIGLRVMRDRARAVGGDVVIHTAPDEGTTVRVVLPHRAAEGSDRPEVS